jgi:hypothetical protein
VGPPVKFSVTKPLGGLAPAAGPLVVNTPAVTVTVMVSPGAG